MAAQKSNVPARVWSAAVVLLGLAFIGVVVAFAVNFFLFQQKELEDAVKPAAIGADLAVMATAIGVWLEYVRKRRTARSRLSRLDTIQADVATDRGELNRLRGRVESLEAQVR